MPLIETSRAATNLPPRGKKLKPVMREFAVIKIWRIRRFTCRLYQKWIDMGLYLEDAGKRGTSQRFEQLGHHDSA